MGARQVCATADTVANEAAHHTSPIAPRLAMRRVKRFNVI
ncbi:hypothetical protein K788_0004251 (plasmid) [Paraburkholderia caribensis MBA4]|uniref:Uncharacterized protein n=1 Tax=Paraburkholderia caribensis MBA4 TaxID=1323664 RepID=A0A0P0RPA9_9BURK|nr:hypothetical protein K788_0004251 [Paraburkholderia caribensis MBA4]